MKAEQAAQEAEDVALQGGQAFKILKEGGPLYIDQSDSISDRNDGNKNPTTPQLTLSEEGSVEYYTQLPGPAKVRRRSKT